jgi:hypothetical protein
MNATDLKERYVSSDHTGMQSCEEFYTIQAGIYLTTLASNNWYLTESLICWWQYLSLNYVNLLTDKICTLLGYHTA